MHTRPVPAEVVDGPGHRARLTGTEIRIAPFPLGHPQTDPHGTRGPESRKAPPKIAALGRDAAKVGESGCLDLRCWVPVRKRHPGRVVGTANATRLAPEITHDGQAIQAETLGPTRGQFKGMPGTPQ